MRPVGLVLSVALVASGCLSSRKREPHASAAGAMGAVGLIASAVGMYMFMIKAGEGYSGCGDGGGTCDSADWNMDAVGAVTIGGAVLMLGGVMLYASAPDARPPLPVATLPALPTLATPPPPPPRQPTEQERAELLRAEQRAAQQSFERERAEQERTKIKNRDWAFYLLKEAQKAARAGDCKAMLKFDRWILEKDASVHAAWFLRDETIKGCLDAARPAASPVAPPVPPDTGPPVP